MKSTVSEKGETRELKAVNPNWKKLNGCDDNCQRCVPTYVLRRQGYDVEALPTGLNEEMVKSDILTLRRVKQKFHGISRT